MNVYFKTYSLQCVDNCHSVKTHPIPRIVLVRFFFVHVDGGRSLAMRDQKARVIS